jgi:hypothetical protein
MILLSDLNSFCFSSLLYHRSVNHVVVVYPERYLQLALESIAWPTPNYYRNDDSLINSVILLVNLIWVNNPHHLRKLVLELYKICPPWIPLPKSVHSFLFILLTRPPVLTSLRIFAIFGTNSDGRTITPRVSTRRSPPILSIRFSTPDKGTVRPIRSGCLNASCVIFKMTLIPESAPPISPEVEANEG